MLKLSSSEKMRIAILVGAFPPTWLAGTEIATYNIAKHLAKRGHEVHVITSLDEGLPNERAEQGFSVHRIGFPKARFLGVVIFWLKILLALRKVNPDIVHAQSTMIALPAFSAKKLLRKPYVVWGRGSDIYLPWLFRSQISKLVLRNTDAAVALTNDMKREVQKICHKEVSVIPNGIDLSGFKNLSREDARTKLQIKQDEKIVLFVGTLRPVKGLKYLIQAMGIITKQDAGVKLLLIGDGEEREYLENLAKQLDLKEEVIFAGKVPNEEVPQYTAASDLFVLPSLSEGFPVTVLEAMASGLPIVTTNVKGLPEIVKEGENGFLVEPRNPEQIAEKVLLLLGNDELRERISENNREKAKRYSWANVVERLEQVYLEVLNKP